MRRISCGVAVLLALCAGPAWVDAAPQPAPLAAQGAPGALIDLNQASAAELRTLPGIGERTAERIIGIAGRTAASRRSRN